MKITRKMADEVQRVLDAQYHSGKSIYLSGLTKTVIDALVDEPEEFQTRHVNILPCKRGDTCDSECGLRGNDINDCYGCEHLDFSKAAKPEVIEWHEGFYGTDGTWLYRILGRTNGVLLGVIHGDGSKTISLNDEHLSKPTRDQLKTKIGTDEKTGEDVYAWAREDGNAVRVYHSNGGSWWFTETKGVEAIRAWCKIVGVVVVTDHQRTKMFNGEYPPK